MGVVCFYVPQAGYAGPLPPAAARCPRPTSATQGPRPSPVTTATPPHPSRHIARPAQAPPSRHSDWSAPIAPSRHSAADWLASLRHGRAVPAGRWRPLLISMAAAPPRPRAALAIRACCPSFPATPPIPAARRRWAPGSCQGGRQRHRIFSL